MLIRIVLVFNDYDYNDLRALSCTSSTDATQKQKCFAKLKGNSLIAILNQ